MGAVSPRSRQRWRRMVESLRPALWAFAALLALAVGGIVLIRSTLLRNAYETGTALSRSYASEARSELASFETLLAFGTSSIDNRLAGGEDRAALEGLLERYFQNLDRVLGNGVVDPYLVLEGEILAANPWEGDATYPVEATQWYQMAVEAGGEVIFTDVYMDAISGRPVVTAAQSCQQGKAVMAFDILLEHFSFAAPEMEAEESFFLCDREGAVIYQQTALQLPRDQVQQYLRGLVERIEAGELADHTSSIQDLDGQTRGVYYTRMENGWYSIVTVPYSTILGDFHWFTLAFGLVVGVAVLAVGLLTWREAGLSLRMERVQETVRVLGKTYYALYRVNFEEETYEMIKGSDYVCSRIAPTGPYQDLLRTAGEVIEADAYRDFTRSFSCEEIRQLVQRRVKDFGGEFLRLFGEEYRWVSVRVLYDESLHPNEVVLSFREVEEEKQRQLQERLLLEDSLQLAKRNEESKQAFFRNMSHDMRTPLGAIIGLTRLAAQHLEDPQQVSGYLKKISSSSQYLLGLINDILDMARMEQGQVMLDNRQFDLEECVEECVGPFREQGEADGKVLDVSLQAADTRLIGDPFRVQQILNNLLSNAFKFTPAGGKIRLEVTQLDQGDYAKYRFVVADTGIGMSEEFLKKLFEPYARELRFDAKRAGGTGLGMSITKSLVAQMNGEIQVESQVGKGSTFSVILPFAAAKEGDGTYKTPAGKEETPFSLEGRTILLAEDNEINMEILDELLTAHGARILQAWNGREAVDRFLETDLFQVDAILMDMQMPVMDGCQAARAIRALPRPDAGRVPIVAVTANAFAEDVAATTQAGMNGHISKPIDFAALCRLLEKLLPS